MHFVNFLVTTILLGLPYQSFSNSHQSETKKLKREIRLQAISIKSGIESIITSERKKITKRQVDEYVQKMDQDITNSFGTHSLLMQSVKDIEKTGTEMFFKFQESKKASKSASAKLIRNSHTEVNHYGEIKGRLLLLYYLAKAQRSCFRVADSSLDYDKSEVSLSNILCTSFAAVAAKSCYYLNTDDAGVIDRTAFTQLLDPTMVLSKISKGKKIYEIDFNLLTGLFSLREYWIRNRRTNLRTAPFLLPASARTKMFQDISSSYAKADASNKKVYELYQVLDSLEKLPEQFREGLDLKEGETQKETFDIDSLFRLMTHTWLGDYRYKPSTKQWSLRSGLHSSYGLARLARLHSLVGNKHLLPVKTNNEADISLTKIKDTVLVSLKKSIAKVRGLNNHDQMKSLWPHDSHILQVITGCLRVFKKINTSNELYEKKVVGRNLKYKGTRTEYITSCYPEGM